MTQGLTPDEGKPDKDLNSFAKLLHSLANHMLLISGCYLVAIVAAQLMIYNRDGQWIGAIRPLYAKIIDSNVAAISADSGVLSYMLDSVNTLFLAGGTMLVFGGIKLALGHRIPPKDVSMEPLIA